MFLSAVFKTDGISEEESDESDSIFIRKKRAWTVSCVIQLQLRLLALIPNLSHASTQGTGSDTVAEVRHEPNIA